MANNLLEKALANHDIKLNLNLEEFESYYSLLKEWNEKIDLTNIIEEEDVYIKHFLDCLTLFKIPEFYKKKSLVDIGTGAGFPGIPLKLANKDLDITLLDSLNKRLIFLDETIRELQLTNIRTIHSRGEDAGQNEKFREKFDIACSRAVSRLNKLVEVTLPLVKVGGIFVAMKGKNVQEEVEEAKRGIETLGGKIRNIIEFNLTAGDNERALVVIEKIKATPKKYPRAFGQIKKKPL